VNAPFPSPIYFKSRFAPGAPPITRAECVEMLVILRRLSPEMRREVLRGLPEAAVRAIADEWWWQARGGQVDPGPCADGSPWRIWSIVAGRGFGKTRAGAEWVWARAREDRDARIALVAASIGEAVRYMIKGESGLIDIARCDEEPRWIAGHNILYFPSGAMAYPYGAVRPEALRGAQHHYAWCDELAKWPNAEAAWDNLMLGLRLGERPRTIVTTTPKPMPLLRRILALPRCVKTHGRTDDNPDSAPDFRTAARDMYDAPASPARSWTASSSTSSKARSGRASCWRRPGTVTFTRGATTGFTAVLKVTVPSTASSSAWTRPPRPAATAAASSFAARTKRASHMSSPT
jgi:hypothetical protein